MAKLIKLSILLGLLFFPIKSFSKPSCKLPSQGITSFYAHQHHGRFTASGEKFNMHAITAANRCLKFGTKLRLTNPKTNKSVIVTINDRGPAAWTKRDLDISYGAAKALGLIKQGVGLVLIEQVE